MTGRGFKIRKVAGNFEAAIALQDCQKFSRESLAKLLSGFEKALRFNTLIKSRSNTMSTKIELVGKTISGVVAVRDDDDEPVKIWMLQFTDGTHVEFVSPAAKRRMRVAARGGRRRPVSRHAGGQMALNVA